MLTFAAALPARAVNVRDIPDQLYRRMPEFIWTIIDPTTLSYLSIADLEEVADEYERDGLHFIRECEIVEGGGSLTHDEARMLLQVPPGAPFIEARFVRFAKQFYGMGVFSRLEWEVMDNPDGSVDLKLWYSSRSPVVILPDIDFGSQSGYHLGGEYQNRFIGREDKQMTAGITVHTEDLMEPRIHGSYTDNTLASGKQRYSVSASVGNTWRRRHNGKPDSSDLRQRISRVDGLYGWKDSVKLADMRMDAAVRGGVYHVDSFVTRGNPQAGDPPAPRSDFDQTGTGVYVGARLSDGRSNNALTPSSGRSVVLNVEQHGGDFPYTRLDANYKRYLPAPNPLGLKPLEPEPYGGHTNVRDLFPMASWAFELQGIASGGDVPYSREAMAGGAVRGIDGSRYLGTKLLAGRAEYRFELDRKRKYKAFVFTDHALVGEDFGSMESVSSYGGGLLFDVPVYGGVTLGLFSAWELGGHGDSGYGLTFGYAF